MTIQMQRRMLHIHLHIDANLINARKKLAAVNRLEKWAADEVILINMSSTARAEAMAGGNAARTRKANQLIFTMTPAASQADPIYRKVEEALFPGGTKSENQRNDVRIVCEASKYGAILVTADGGSKSQPGGILGNRAKLANIVRVLSPDEAVEFVRGKIKERDEYNARVAKECGGQLPSWNGAD